MPALICGSLAFDTITNFPGRFAQQILPEQVHILNVSFVVPTLRREWGGCAGNIAYTLKLLGGEPVVLAALGSDGDEYLARLKSLMKAPVIFDGRNLYEPWAMRDAGFDYVGIGRGSSR